MWFIIAAVISILALGAFLAYRQFLGKHDRGIGFLEYVRNPKAAKHLSEDLDNWKAEVARAATRPPKELVAMLLEDAGPLSLPCRAIEAAGPDVVPALLEAVADPRFRGGKQVGPFGLPQEPLEAVLSCLANYAPPESIPAVAPLVDDASDDIRKQAASLLGSIGSDDAIPLLQRLLSDENEYVRNYAMRGIMTAINAGRTTARFRAAMYEAIKPLAFRRDRTVSGDAPRCLLLIDRQAAIAYLTDENNLSVGRENLHYVLRALREENVEISEAHLLRMVTEIESVASKHPNDRVLGELLRLLARFNSDAARGAIQRGMQHASRHVRESAAKAVADAVDLANPLAAAWDRLKSHGWDGLSTAQRHVLAVRILINEVKNGGFLQYFVNDSGNHWRDAADGLSAIGGTTDRKLLEEVVGRFGAQPPSEDRDTRHEQVARLARRSNRPFESIERRFYEDADDREVLLLKYVVQHADEFRNDSQKE
jgi:HEAT repeat protein